MKTIPKKRSSHWWQGAFLYQIYPRSFNNGTLNGITEKLDYITSLGAKGIWICPFFTSPMKDFGYDISDYRDIDPQFGTLNDFKTLLAEAHKRDLKIIIDLVLSHTSIEHPWFTEKPEYYVWADGQTDFSPDKAQGATCSKAYTSDAATQSGGKYGRPPNNWVSVFGGSAWTWHEDREQYYLHNFLPEQPDLNFHNKDVQTQTLDIAKFWLDLGVDGFRLDVVNFYFHDTELRDNPPRDTALGAATQFEGSDPYSTQNHIYDKSRPENLAFLKRLQSLVESYGAFTIGEIGDDHPYARATEYTAPGLLNTCYNPQMMAGTQKALTADLIRAPIEQFLKYATQNQIPSWAFTNHDVVRAASRWLPPKGTENDGFDHDPRLSKMLIALLGSLNGTLFLYQGEELGLPEAKLAFKDLQDPWGKRLYPQWQGRDGCRTPMPWDAQTLSQNHWLPTPKSHADLTVQTQETDENSPLNFTRKFIHWRNAKTPLIHGDITFKDTYNEKLLAFTRSTETQTIDCLFNLSHEPQIHEGKTLKPYGFSLSSSGKAPAGTATSFSSES